MKLLSGLQWDHLALQFKLQCVFSATVICQICGQSVDGRDYLSCGHVTYQEGSQPALFRKPSGGHS